MTLGWIETASNVLAIKWLQVSGAVGASLHIPHFLQVTTGTSVVDAWVTQFSTIAGAFIVLITALGAIPTAIMKWKKMLEKKEREKWNNDFDDLEEMHLELLKRIREKKRR